MGCGEGRGQSVSLREANALQRAIQGGWEDRGQLAEVSPHRPPESSQLGGLMIGVGVPTSVVLDPQGHEATQKQGSQQ